jgi:hypothetical protein
MVSAMAQTVVIALEEWRRRTAGAGAGAGAHLMATAALWPMGGAQVLGMTLAQALWVTAVQVPRAMVTTMMMMTTRLHP